MRGRGQWRPDGKFTRNHERAFRLFLDPKSDWMAQPSGQPE
jgi:hypothetical protein